MDKMRTNYENGKVQAPLYLWQMASVALCEWACGYDNGRSKDDPVYRLVTENRDGPGPEQRKHYSSCADLGHFLLMRLGVREKWINRTDDGTFGPWMPGANVSLLWGSSCPIDSVPDADWQPEPGDILILWNTGNDAHVCVAIAPLEQGRLKTANYGAGGMSPSAIPGAKLGSNKLIWDGKHWVYGSKIVQRCLKLKDIISVVSVKPILTEGCSLTGEVIDALELGVDPDA